MPIKAIAVDPKNPAAFIEISPEKPTPGQYDLLVEVKAVSVNPVDTKVHAGLQKSGLHAFSVGTPAASWLKWAAASAASNPAMRFGTPVISLARAATAPNN